MFFHNWEGIPRNFLLFPLSIQMLCVWGENDCCWTRCLTLNVVSRDRRIHVRHYERQHVRHDLYIIRRTYVWCQRLEDLLFHCACFIRSPTYLAFGGQPNLYLSGNQLSVTRRGLEIKRKTQLTNSKNCLID